MKITKIIGESGELSALCDGGACPAAVLTEDGNVFVQGYVPEAAEQNELTAPKGESFVKMPLATLRRIASQIS